MRVTGRRIIVGLALLAVMCIAPLPVDADWAEGVDAFQKRDYRTAITEFDTVIERAPDYAGAYYMKGRSQRALGQTSQALASLRQAVELDGSNALYRVALGEGLLQTGKYAEAYSTLKPVSLNQVDARTRSSFALLFANAATKTNRSDEAARILSQQIQTDGRNPKLHRALGVAYDASGNDGRAYSSFRRAFELDSTDKSSAREAIRTAITAGRRSQGSADKKRYYTEAGSIAERLVGIEATFDHHLLAGESWLGAKEYSRALGWFDKARQQNPKNALVYFYRGQCNSSLNRLDRAAEEFQEALKAGPTQRLRGQIYNNLGYVYDKQQKYDDAIRIYRELGNQQKVQQMVTKKEQQANNRAADAERARFRQQVNALRQQIQELEKLGESEEVKMLREQLTELEKALREL
ncbi:MAG: tetratricopeptide repeat protein [bacterium]|nr:tetratricopeptide repeat protein [bacterium]